MGKVVDLVGKKFCKLLVIERALNNVRGRAQWKCICDCGNTTEVASDKLVSGRTKSCGCAKSKHIYEDLTGRKFGRLTVIEYKGQKKDHIVLWLCKCECGNERIIPTSHLKNGHTISCGCFQKEKAKQAKTTHGLRKTRLYEIWNGVLQRCYNPNRAKYKNYGGRGITVCEEWRDDFKAFYDWAMSNGYRDDLTIDRIDNNGDYEPSNCRWVTVQEQAYNKSTSRFITYKGETKTIGEWAKIAGLKTTTLWVRLNKLNWSVEKAIETPIK